MEEIIKEVTKVTIFSKLPKWLKVLLIIISIITIVYWLVWLFIKGWSLLGKFLHWASDKKNWWLYTSCILILIIGALVIAQLFSDLKPFTCLIDNVKELTNRIRDYLGSKIKG